jgi:membrane protein implicated in regulation of membrane protease activity
MTDSALQARNRWLIISGVRLLAIAGAVFAVVLIARAPTWPPKVLGVAIVLSALYMSWAVPASLAHRWRTPDEAPKRTTKTRR